MFGKGEVEWGPYGPGIADTPTWVLPNPSSLNKTFTLAALVRAYSEARAALAEGGRARRAMMTRQRVGHGSMNLSPVTSSRRTQL
jgi:TDG/mug DNA glycosylase family protein